MSFKGYSRYKTITSQNVSSETQLKNFYQICDVMMSVSTWDRVPFWICLLNHNSWSHKLGQVIDISKANNYQEFFKHLRGPGLSSRSCSIYLPTRCNYSTANYVKISVFHFFEEVNNWTFTNGKCEL